MGNLPPPTTTYKPCSSTSTGLQTNAIANPAPWVVKGGPQQTDVPLAMSDWVRAGISYERPKPKEIKKAHAEYSMHWHLMSVDPFGY
ncbi:hypothetical protein PGQ11_006816 [Apiospora arundinis]|uniref:Uncharacterized protein n=1 Tax=Apiospora arundinis TaxID=335852 RepID=A0ABR2IUR5_9PEZI